MPTTTSLAWPTFSGGWIRLQQLRTRWELNSRFFSSFPCRLVCSSALQNQKTVSAYFTSKQILPFSFGVDKSESGILESYPPPICRTRRRRGGRVWNLDIALLWKRRLLARWLDCGAIPVNRHSCVRHLSIYRSAPRGCRWAGGTALLEKRWSNLSFLLGQRLMTKLKPI